MVEADDILVIILVNLQIFKDLKCEIWLNNFELKNKEVNIVNCSKLSNSLREYLALPKKKFKYMSCFLSESFLPMLKITMYNILKTQFHLVENKLNSRKK